MEKITHLDTTHYAWSDDDIRAIAAPTLIVLGDFDGIGLDHAVAPFGLLCCGVMRDCRRGGDRARCAPARSPRAARYRGSPAAPTGGWP